MKGFNLNQFYIILINVIILPAKSFGWQETYVNR
jgi:hypothetical protein